jgi:hypothetical protein
MLRQEKLSTEGGGDRCACFVGQGKHVRRKRCECILGEKAVDSILFHARHECAALENSLPLSDLLLMEALQVVNLHLGLLV